MNLAGEIETVARGLARHRDKLRLDTLWKGQGRVFIIQCAADDYGRLVGAKGWTIQAINILARRAVREPITVAVERDGPSMKLHERFETKDEDRLSELVEPFRIAVGWFNATASVRLDNRGPEIWADVEHPFQADAPCAALSSLLRAMAMSHGKRLVLRFHETQPA